LIYWAEEIILFSRNLFGTKAICFCILQVYGEKPKSTRPKNGLRLLTELDENETTISSFSSKQELEKKLVW
jgi:hypothetical protein